jgi:hypothetical protein
MVYQQISPNNHQKLTYAKSHNQPFMLGSVL